MPLVVWFLVLSVFNISLPTIKIILSILKPFDFSIILATPSLTRLTAICELYSSPVSNAEHNLLICTSAGFINKQ